MRSSMTCGLFRDSSPTCVHVHDLLSQTVHVHDLESADKPTQTNRNVAFLFGPRLAAVFLRKSFTRFITAMVCVVNEVGGGAPTDFECSRC